MKQFVTMQCPHVSTCLCKQKYVFKFNVTLLHHMEFRQQINFDFKVDTSHLAWCYKYDDVTIRTLANSDSPYLAEHSDCYFRYFHRVIHNAGSGQQGPGLPPPIG